MLRFLLMAMMSLTAALIATPSQAQTTTITIELRLDFSPNETSVRITDSISNIVFNQRANAVNPRPGPGDTINLLVTLNCGETYSFIIFDDNGTGQQNFPPFATNVGYTVFDSMGNPIIGPRGPWSGSSQSTVFTIPPCGPGATSSPLTGQLAGGRTAALNTLEFLQENYTDRVSRRVGGCGAAHRRGEDDVQTVDDAFEENARACTANGEFETLWDVWGGAGITIVDDSAIIANGQTVNLVVGVDRQVNQHWLVGALIGIGLSDFDMVEADSAFTSDGVTFGLYGGGHVHDNIIVDILGTASLLSMENTHMGDTGDFDGHRLAIMGRVSGYYELGAYRIEPGIKAYYAHEHHEAYDLSMTRSVDDQDFYTLSVAAGPRISRAVRYDNSTMELWTSLDLEYRATDIDEDASLAGTDLDDLSGRVQAGVHWEAATGLNLDLSLGASGLGSDELSTFDGNLRFAIPF